jgi:hypothetical protein
MKPHYHRIISVLVSISFLVVVQLFATPEPIFRFLLPAFAGYLICVGIYNRFYIRSVGSFNWWVWLRPHLLLIGWFGMLMLLPNEFFRGMYLLLGLPLLYIVEVNVSGVGEQLLFNETLLTAFAFCMGVMAAVQYFPRTHILYSISVFAAMSILCRTSFQSTPLDERAKWVSAMILALFTTELFWVLSFLPLHFSALGVILFNLFYFCWALYYYYVFNHLTPKKFQFHLVLAIFFTFVMIFVTRWDILL